MATSDRSRLSLCEPFAVAGFRVDPGLLQISTGDTLIHLEPKAMGVLCLLAANQGQTVSREQLFQTVWDGRVVVDESLTRAMSQLRHAFDDNPREPRIFQTVPKTGYRLIAPVELFGDVATGVAAPALQTAERKKTVRATAAAVVLAALLVLLLIDSDFERAPPKNSLAVLPFVNMSGDASEGYLSDGMTEEILNSLARVDGIKLVGRTSSFKYKNKQLDLREVGEQLGVENILEGSVRRAGDRIRITVQLVNARDGYHLWSHVYDREFRDAFAVQQEIAEAIAGKLELSADESLLASERTDNLDAYTWYLKGNKLARETDFRNAADAYHQAIDLDPNFSPPYSRYVWACLATWGIPVTQECRERAEPYIARAQQLNPASADVDVGYGLIYDILHKDYVESRKALERAISRDPDNVFALMNLAYALTVTWGEDEQAIKHHARVFRLEPLSFGTRITYARALAHLGRVPDAERELRKMIDMDPDYGVPYMALAGLKFSQPPVDYKQGFQLLHEGLRRQPDLAPFAAAEAAIDLQDFAMADYWLGQISNAMPDTFYALQMAFRVKLAQGDYDSAYWVSRRMAAVETLSMDHEWNSLVSVAWLRLLQLRDPQLAARAYISVYPSLADESPIIAEWNYAAAIGFAMLQREQGDTGAAQRLLARVRAYLDAEPAQHPLANAALAVVEGDLQAALAILVTSAAGGHSYGWWLPERDALFSPLWSAQEFRELQDSMRARIEQQRDELHVLRRNGELPSLPTDGIASR